MKTGTATGVQIAFFTFAVLLLAVPLTQWLTPGGWHPATRALLGKVLIFGLGASILFGVPRLRRQCVYFLRPQIPRDRRLEVTVVTAAKLLFPFALAGGYALWHWIAGGEARLAHYVRGWRSDEAELAHAFLAAHMLQMFLLAGIVAPVLEELVFRGLLYSAWERQWGWFPSMLATSLLFGLYHPDVVSAFLGSVIFVCLYRRTGSLWAPIIAHAVTNISLWYPFLGRHFIPRDAAAPGDLGSWGLQLACLLAALVAIPAYMWMARRKREPEPVFPPTVPHGAIPR